jgi:hypothetical protein
VWIRDHVHGLPLGKSGSTSGPNQIVTPNGNATFGTGGWAEVTDAGNKGITDAAGSYTSDQTGGLVTSPLSANPGQEFTQSAQGNVNMRPRYYGTGAQVLHRRFHLPSGEDRRGFDLPRGCVGILCVVPTQ